MRNAGLEEAQAGIKIARRNITLAALLLLSLWPCGGDLISLYLGFFFCKVGKVLIIFT